MRAVFIAFCGALFAETRHGGRPQTRYGRGRHSRAGIATTLSSGCRTKVARPLDGDTTGRGSHEDTMVAIFSLGAPRALLLRPRGGGGASRRYEIGHGDLLVMGGSCQRTWEHAVPKTARWVGPRLSVQFRPRGVRLSPETGALSTLPAADYEATMDLSPTEE
jgi:2OG-Fe(II) oxygenase superfamily